jgi:hypothetical protein
MPDFRSASRRFPASGEEQTSKLYNYLMQSRKRGCIIFFYFYEELDCTINGYTFIMDFNSNGAPEGTI